MKFRERKSILCGPDHIHSLDNYEAFLWNKNIQTLCGATKDRSEWERKPNHVCVYYVNFPLELFYVHYVNFPLELFCVWWMIDTRKN